MDIAAFEKKCTIEICTSDVEGLCIAQLIKDEWWYDIHDSNWGCKEVVHNALIYLEYHNLVVRSTDPRTPGLVQIKAFVAEMD